MSLPCLTLLSLLYSLSAVIWKFHFILFFLLVTFQSLQTAEEEVEKMAAIAEQEKLKNINMEKQLEALGPFITDAPDSSSVPELQQALQDKDK